MRPGIWPLLVVLLAACGPATVGVDMDGNGNKCVPGTTQTCVCLGGGEGMQTCRASGTSFGACTGCGNDVPDLPNSQNPAGSECGDCDGCCDGSTCIKTADQSDPSGKCGPRGSTCAPCAGGKICIQGTGVCGTSTGASCADCPNGCCKNGACLIDQNVACGPQCMKCTYGVGCADGSCTTQLDSNAQFKIIVRSIQLTPKDPTGGSWDGFGGGEADPQACFAYQSNGTFLEGCTKYCSNSLMCNYSDSDGLIVDSNGSPVLFPATILMAGTMRVAGQDNDDPLPADDAGQAYFPATSVYKSSYSTGMFGNVVNITFELH
jgi:hypothetical protein